MDETLICKDCGAVTPRRSPTQRYCPTCSEKHDLHRKRQWSRRHPPTAAQLRRIVKHHAEHRELAREAGMAANLQRAESILWNAQDDPPLLWMARISVPFSYAVSKNHIYTLRRAGHVVLRREARDARRAIALLVGEALAGRRIAHNKVWIDLLVQKPDHKGDAVNVIDVVCDALKDALPVDDRWFCIRRLDWQIVKSNPQLFIGIGQASDRDCQICSYCGQIKELAAFNRSSGRPLGVGRECKDCRRSGRLLARQRNQTALKDSQEGRLDIADSRK